MQCTCNIFHIGSVRIYYFKRKDFFFISDKCSDPRSDMQRTSGLSVVAQFMSMFALSLDTLDNTCFIERKNAEYP